MFKHYFIRNLEQKYNMDIGDLFYSILAGFGIGLGILILMFSIIGFISFDGVNIYGLTLSVIGFVLSIVFIVSSLKLLE